MVLDYARFMPPTLIARRIEDVREFHARHPGDLVMKPLHGNGGKAVVRIPADGSNLGALIELFDKAWVEPHMVQPFLPDIAQGDKRIVLVDGEVAGAINRRPGEGEFRSNLAVGGSAEATTLTAREEEICAAHGPGTEGARAGVRRHRCDRRQMADRNQRDLAHRDRRDRPVQRHRHAGADLGCDRAAVWGDGITIVHCLSSFRHSRDGGNLSPGLGA